MYKKMKELGWKVNYMVKNIGIEGYKANITVDVRQQ
jgi:hypothetical protein